MSYRALTALAPLASIGALALLFVPESAAVVHVGNPHVDFRVLPPEGTLIDGTVDLYKVRVHICGGGYDDYIVDETIDPVAGYGLDVTGGDLCGVTLFWDSRMLLDGENSLGDYSLGYDELTTYVQLGTPTEPVALTPFTIAEGELVGTGDPELDLEVDR